MRPFLLSLLALSLATVASPAVAQPAPPAPAPAPGPAPAPAPASTEPPPYTIGAYAEVAYSFNFNRPSNGITALRGFDNRHNTFLVSNAALDGQWDFKGVNGRVTLQVGQTPDTYYASEPSLNGGGGTPATGPNLWKYIQQAFVGYRFDWLKGLNVNFGIFLSPIGPEGMAVKDNWNWSRSNLFFALPFYHTGIRVTLQVTDEISFQLWGVNGWNNVVDNNDGKDIGGVFTYAPKNFTFNALYFGGPERNKHAPEGQPWRSTFDVNATWQINDYVALLGHGDAGFENSNFGYAWWGAGALYARVHPLKPLYFAVRGDAFYEKVPANPRGTASPIFWPVPWVSSATFTAEAKPHDNVSFRLEYRHDQAGGKAYYEGDVQGDGSAANPFVANARAQNTITLGATGWFP